MKQSIEVKAEGHLLIRDADSKEVIRDTHNDIHLENFSEAIALSLGGYDRGFIEEMHFGSGGSIISATGEIDYNDNQANPGIGIATRDADLYGPSSGYKPYFKVINERSSRFISDPDKNNIKIVHTNGTTYTDIVITCTLDYGEPDDQSAFDDASTMKDDYVFDEMGLKTYDSVTETKRLLTHVIFHPVQKAANRAIEIVYTIRITMIGN